MGFLLLFLLNFPIQRKRIPPRETPIEKHIQSNVQTRTGGHMLLLVFNNSSQRLLNV